MDIISKSRRILKETTFLKKQDFKFLRFENRFVFQYPEYILEEFRKHFKKSV